MYGRGKRKKLRKYRLKSRVRRGMNQLLLLIVGKVCFPNVSLLHIGTGMVFSGVMNHDLSDNEQYGISHIAALLGVRFYY